MAEQIPFNIIADALTKLGSSAIQLIGSAFGVSKELTNLTKKLDTINGVLVDAEKRQEESGAVKAWVGRLKDVVYDADDLLDDFETLQLQPGGVARQVSDFFSSSNQLLFRFKMSNRVKHIKEEIDEIVKEIPMLSLIQGNITQPEAESSWRETHSFVLTSQIVGREENKKEMIESLMSSTEIEENLSIVAIVGIGGLGKTTLAQLVFNDPRIVEYFELKIWVCVSNPFEVKSLVKEILKEVCDQDIERLELNGLKNLLHEKLSEKRCFFVLDDVWNESYEKWDQLKSLLMVVGKGSKILVTTRHSKVASIMGIDAPFVLEGLKDTQPWDLFAKMAFKEPEKVHPKFVEIGKEIVNMCKGVPLIVKTLGTTLRMKTEESHWLSIKNNKNLLSLRDGSDNVLLVLKLSYDNLPLPLKQCFAYCALFPKDYQIQKNLLVQLWMAQGYIQPLDERIGDQYFDELLSRSLLEVFDKDAYNNILSCKMHDLIHDLALSVIGSEVLILEDDVKKIRKEVHHASLFDPVNLKLKALKVRHVRTFLSILPYDPNGSIPIQSVSSFKCLRVLSLNGFYLKKVSRSLGKLNHLRYLDLSRNSFEVLPNSITSLKNLQTLKLVGCRRLKQLPKDTRELINLRHLENDWCRDLSHMPCGIGELTMLQSLSVFIVENVGNRRGVGRLSELKGLHNLRGELQIEGLENVRDAVESREANLGEKQYILSLTLIWRRSEAQLGEDVDSMLEGLQPHSNLKQLYIETYGGERFPSWMMNGGLSCVLPNLTTIDMGRCSRCQTLPCFVQLPHLKSLKLDDLAMVEYMEECSSEGPFFPSLKELSLSRMPRLKQLWRKCLPTHPPPSFPCLSQLLIEHCDDLASLELHSAPLLFKLKIHDCAELPSLQLPSSPLLSRLHIESCGNLASLELHSCPLLYRLGITHCPLLTSIILPPSPLLSYVQMKSCGNLESLKLHSSPFLSELEIADCRKLTSFLLPPSPLLSYVEISSCYLASLDLDSSPVLVELEISCCPKLASLLLPPSPLLSQLKIRKCSSLTSLELHSSPLLSELEISECRGLTSLSLPPSPRLSQLKIRYCDELASLELHSSPLLSKLDIYDCHKLTSLLLPPSPSLSCVEIELCHLGSLELHSSPLLSRLRILSCPKLISLQVSSLPCLNTLELARLRGEILRQLMLSTTASSLESVCISLIEDDLMSLPDELHQHGSTLRTLKIWGCSSLATLPHWIGNLTSLTDLTIGSCLQLTSLPEELGSLRLLQSLSIDSCTGLIALPDRIGNLTSLTSLKIFHCPRLTSLPEELGSLRLLQSLSIEYCSGLIALPNRIVHLTSLFSLKISCCPQLASLPERMRSLTSLDTLEIVDCAYLSERCRRKKGEDWPKIAHVSYISINGTRV